MRKYLCNDCNLERLLKSFAGKTFEDPRIVLNSLSELNKQDMEDYVKVKGLDVLKQGRETLLQGIYTMTLGGIALNHQIGREMEFSDFLIVGGLWFGALASTGATLLHKNETKELSEKLEEICYPHWSTFIRENKGMYQLSTESVKDPKDNSWGSDEEIMNQKSEEGKKIIDSERSLENRKQGEAYVLVNGVLVTECESRNETADVIDFKTGIKLEEESYSTNLKIVTKNEFGLKTADAYIEAPTNELLGQDRSLLGQELWMLCQYEGEKIRVVDYGPAVNITPTVPEVIRKVQV